MSIELLETCIGFKQTYYRKIVRQVGHLPEPNWPT